MKLCIGLYCLHINICNNKLATVHAALHLILVHTCPTTYVACSSICSTVQMQHSMQLFIGLYMQQSIKAKNKIQRISNHILDRQSLLSFFSPHSNSIHSPKTSKFRMPWPVWYPSVLLIHRHQQNFAGSRCPRGIGGATLVVQQAIMSVKKKLQRWWYYIDLF